MKNSLFALLLACVFCMPASADFSAKFSNKIKGFSAAEGSVASKGPGSAFVGVVSTNKTWAGVKFNHSGDLKFGDTVSKGFAVGESTGRGTFVGNFVSAGSFSVKVRGRFDDRPTGGTW